MKKKVWLITIKRIESVTKSSQINKNPGPDGFAGELYQAFKEYQSFSNSSKKIEKEGDPLNSFYKTNITMIPKSDKDTMKKEVVGQYLWWI